MTIFNKPNHAIKIICKSHGEKRCESLLTAEEMAKAIDMGEYYRIPADVRDLNYDEYYDKGDTASSKPTEYNSDNTNQLAQKELMELLRNTVPEIREAMKNTADKPRMTILITGANGFIGKNLTVYLKHLTNVQLDILTYTRESNPDDLITSIQKSDFIFHLAGENRPKKNEDFFIVNTQLTQKICALCSQYNPIPIVFASSSQATCDNDYGRSKREAEQALEKYANDAKAPVYIYRLPNVFRKWIKPNYNSFVATLCYNMIHGLSYQIDDFEKYLTLVYVDDVVQNFAKHLKQTVSATAQYLEVSIVYHKKLSDIAALLKAFHAIFYD